MSDFLNKKVGGFGLGLIFLSAYLGVKFGIVGLGGALAWGTIWFTALILSALAADLFSQTKDVWVYNTLKNIQSSNLPFDEKKNAWKFILEQAVNRWYSIFIKVNGFDNVVKKSAANLQKIFKGIITIKELIIIVAWALFDLVIREGLLGLTNPIDVIVLFGGLAALKIVDANSGFPSLVADMYKDAMKEKNPDFDQLAMEDWIRQLGTLFTVDQEKAQTPEEEAESLIDRLNAVIPKLQTLEA